jgi:hypothetical protein
VTRIATEDVHGTAATVVIAIVNSGLDSSTRGRRESDGGAGKGCVWCDVVLTSEQQLKQLGRNECGKERQRAQRRKEREARGTG